MGLGRREGKRGSHKDLGVTRREMSAVAMGVGWGTGGVGQAEVKVAGRGKLGKRGPLGEQGDWEGMETSLQVRGRVGELFFPRF